MTVQAVALAVILPMRMPENERGGRLEQSKWRDVASRPSNSENRSPRRPSSSFLHLGGHSKQRKFTLIVLELTARPSASRREDRRRLDERPEPSVAGSLREVAGKGGGREREGEGMDQLGQNVV